MSASRTPSPFWQAFGPGLLWASAAIGVSHLVQSTRAGANAGFGLAWVILAALVLKYPFFEYGPRYAAATGESLVEGYLRVGRWALWLYLLITISTAMIIQVAVVLFTAFIARNVFGLTWSMPVMTGAVLATCAGVLMVGRFRGLDRASKLIIALLSVSTLFAAVVAARRVDPASFTPWPLGPDVVAFPFILALVGWMPSAFDISVWSSLWTLAKNRATGTRASVAHALLDFRIGYVGTGMLAFAFVTLGAGVMHGSGTSFSDQGTQFSVQLVDLYAQTLGNWLRPIVLVAMLTTMFSTSLTVIDGFPRAIARSVWVVRHGLEPAPDDVGPVYWGAGAVLGGLTVVIVLLFIGTLTAMVDFATIVSFFTAPALGYLNLRAVTAPHVPVEARPGPGLRRLSIVGLALLGGTAVAYVIW
ncbi:MAG: divalent metal cation transporter [Gemmatimonadota bacterium]|nr:divalent metal cation transporter [Gemmatimonadota bacterium]